MDAEKPHKKFAGVSLGLTFITISIFLYFNPLFLGLEIVSYIIGATFGLFGFIGLSVEVTKVGQQYKEAMNNLAVSILIGVILYSVYYFFSNILVNIIVLAGSTLALFGFFTGALQAIKVILQEENLRGSLQKTLILLLNLVTFILTVLQIVKIIKS